MQISRYLILFFASFLPAFGLGGLSFGQDLDSGLGSDSDVNSGSQLGANSGFDLDLSLDSDLGGLSDAQIKGLKSCGQETDNLQRLLCYDLVMGEDTLEQALIPSAPSHSFALLDYKLPALAPVLNLLEENRQEGEPGWQFAITRDRGGEFLLLNVLYGPSTAFGRLSSIYWPQPTAVLQTGIEAFASQRGRLNDHVFLVASCQQDFPALRLALDRPLSKETYQVEEIYPDGTRRQGNWRTVDDGLVLEMARGIPAFEAMKHMSVDGVVNFSFRDGQDLRFFEFSTRNFADIATSIGLSCNTDLVQTTLDRGGLDSDTNTAGPIIALPPARPDSDTPTNNSN